MATITPSAPSEFEDVTPVIGRIDVVEISTPPTSCAVAVGALAVARNILAAIASKFFFPIIMDLFVNTILC